MQSSGLVSPSGHRVLSQSPVTRSLRPAFTLTAELFIKGKENTGDPANFSMGLLAVLTVGCPMKRRALRASSKWSVTILLNIFMKWTSPAIHTIKSALSDSVTCGRADGSCVCWTDMALAAFKDTEWWRVGVWTSPSQIYWVHSHSIGSIFFKGWGLCQLSSSKRVCICWCPFITGGEPLRHAEVNLAYDILPSTESL